MLALLLLFYSFNSSLIFILLYFKCVFFVLCLFYYVPRAADTKFRYALHDDRFLILDIVSTHEVKIPIASNVKATSVSPVFSPHSFTYHCYADAVMIHRSTWP